MFNILKLFKPKQKALLGIDISSFSIKILVISSSGEKHTVEGYGCASIPPGVLEGGIIKDIDSVANIIRKLVSTLPTVSKAAAIAVSDSSAISKIIQVSEGMTEDEIEELVVMEADKYIPYPIDEINLDFSILGPSAKNPSLIDVLLVASRSEYVTNRVEVIKRAGLEPTIVDVESYAVERAAMLFAHELPGASDKKIIAIIDIGAVYTHLFILQGNKIIFSRDEEFGGKQLIDSIVDQYGMNFIDAAEALENETLNENAEVEVLQPFKELILLQVKRTLQFFFSTSHYTYVDYIILAGGVVKLKGIAELLHENINIPTFIANPFTNMDINQKINQDKFTKDIPRLMVACGLALRRPL